MLGKGEGSIQFNVCAETFCWKERRVDRRGRFGGAVADAAPALGRHESARVERSARPGDDAPSRISATIGSGSLAISASRSISPGASPPSTGVPGPVARTGSTETGGVDAPSGA